ncbi:MAG: hypothetical protein KGS72_05215 [Cyanobacteria bacterium REEB67]|nr:hypothetical protein [Cyanobacteria bacterium REEB67]
MNRAASKQILAVALLASALFPRTAQCFSTGENIHSLIVKDALLAVLNENNLKLVTNCLQAQAGDKDLPADRLFTSATFKNSVNFVDREQKKALDFAAQADVSQASRYHCLKHFGKLLFVAQEFYSRSDYIEIEAAVAQYKKTDSAFNPYNIDLVDWSALINKIRKKEPLPYGPATITKENEEQTATPLGNSTYFKTARELAVRETQRQWELLELLIKRRYHERALTIIAALREASCPAEEPDSLD